MIRKQNLIFWACIVLVFAGGMVHEFDTTKIHGLVISAMGGFILIINTLMKD